MVATQPAEASSADSLSSEPSSHWDTVATLLRRTVALGGCEACHHEFALCTSVTLFSRRSKRVSALMEGFMHVSKGFRGKGLRTGVMRLAFKGVTVASSLHAHPMSVSACACLQAERGP